MVVLVLVSVGLVVASPWALDTLNASGLDWTRLSSIGQTYGAVSAIIAAIALLGVVATLIVQSREAKAARLNAHRGYHAELMRMAMDDPRYMECWGPYLTESFDAEVQLSYVNLIVSQWYAEYHIGELSDASLRMNAASVFSSVPGRHYWETSRANWRNNYSGRRVRRFYQILEDRYREAVKRPPSTPPAQPASASSQPRRSTLWPTVLGAAGGAAAVVGLRAARRVFRARISRRGNRS